MNEDIIKERLGECGEDGIFHDDKFVCNRIHYDKDAIIEASAGTGKTYTLQSIVLKLLLEKEAAPDKRIGSVKNLLLVTYTEKAAGELKDKIRTVLEEAGCREEVSIATKLPQYLVRKSSAIDKYFDEELRRLRTDYVDYYLMHMVTDVQ